LGGGHHTRGSFTRRKIRVACLHHTTLHRQLTPYYANIGSASRTNSPLRLRQPPPLPPAARLRLQATGDGAHLLLASSDTAYRQAWYGGEVEALHAAVPGGTQGAPGVNRRHGARIARVRQVVICHRQRRRHCPRVSSCSYLCTTHVLPFPLAHGVSPVRI
jgi:hypothetical protein